VHLDNIPLAIDGRTIACARRRPCARWLPRRRARGSATADRSV